MERDTNIFGLMGFPLGHSLSPFIHNTIYKHLNINGVYTLFQIEESKLPDAFNALKVLNIKGINITIPYKEKALSYLNEISDDALSIGAVNTIVNENGLLKGYNTDYIGFGKSLKVNDINIINKDIFVIGTGGAARSVTLYLLKNNARVHIFGRNSQKLTDFKKFFENKYRNIVSYDLNDIGCSLRLVKPHMIINCTPSGMKGNLSTLSLNFDDIKGNVDVFYDLVYNPLKTQFMSVGDMCSCKVVTGMDMLLLQAFESIYIWTGKTIDYEYGKHLLEREGLIKNM